MPIGLNVIALLPTPVANKGVPQTVPPVNSLKTTEHAKPIYKDFYSKTQVIVTPVLSTVAYQEVDYMVPLNETWDKSEVAYVATINSTLGVATPSLMSTIRPQRAYEEFEWPTETQMYTTALNATTTRVVENTLAFV
ncbi:hypothetical protein FHG87_015981 [Trinorchestia longiramus]|nr:hypothetical protein FHG87_015981 [Trinorchestia longiramus]